MMIPTENPTAEPYQPVADNQPGQWWLVYVRIRGVDGPRQVYRTQLPHLLAESANWWVQATLPEGRKQVQPAQWHSRK